MASAPRGEKTPPPPLPATLTNELPSVSKIVAHLDAACKLASLLAGDLEAAKRRGAISLARAFIVLHRLNKFADDAIKPISILFERYKTTDVPQSFELSKLTSLPVEEGYRVAVQSSLRATVKADYKMDAYEWMRVNHPALVTETVNASTLSALATELEREKNLSLPEELFNTYTYNVTSVTRT